MKQVLLIVLATILGATVVSPQTKQPPVQPPSAQQQPPVQQRPATPFEVSEYGVQFEADPRLVVVMAALDAAGFDPAPGGAPSTFRTKLRKDLANLDPELRHPMQVFYERY
jgi:hypothetical protein